MKIEELKKKRVLILGFGREGRDTFSFLRKKFPGKTFGIADRLSAKELPRESQRLLRTKGVLTHLGKNYLKFLKNYDIIIKSPGIPPRVIKHWIAKKQTVTSQTDIFFENCEGTVIGVTGTKGKSTTASLIYAVLKEGGIKAHLIGNIEKPVLQFLQKSKPEDVFVYELSSFQLMGLKQSPHIGVLLNLYPEHLDYHRNFKEYADAKANITRFQTETDFFIYNSEDPIISRIAKSSKAQKIPFTPRKDPSVPWIASTEPPKIIGKLFGIPQKKIREAMRNFKPLPHRLERVGEWKGITFYNDSLATIPEATISALRILGPKVSTLIVGGFDRGISFEKLAKEIWKSKVKTLILLPTTGEKIWQELVPLAKTKVRRRIPVPYRVQSMKEAVKLSYLHTKRGTICLLSPASPSFNLFRDYKERGNQFKRFVKMYGEI